MNWPVTLPSGMRFNLDQIVAEPKLGDSERGYIIKPAHRLLDSADWPAFCAAWAEYERACRERYAPRGQGIPDDVREE